MKYTYPIYVPTYLRTYSFKNRTEECFMTSLLQPKLITVRG